MSQVMALKLGRDCPHCGEQLTVLFKRDMSANPKGGLMAAVVHGLIEHLDTGRIEWKPVTGFDDAVKLPNSEIPW